MDSMSEQDMQAVAMVLKQCSTYIPVELDHDVAIVDLSTVDMDKLGRGLSSACVPRLLKAYRPDMKSISWWQNGCQSKRKLKCKTTPRVSAFNKQLDVFSVSGNGKPYTLNAKGRGNRRYLGFGIRVFGQNHTAYLHNLIMAETMARVHPSTWNRVKTAWDVDYLTWTGYTVHHILPYETLTGNTPMNLKLLDDWTHETTKVQYNQLRRRIIDHDLDFKMLILPKNGAMQAIRNIPILG